jgi:hypothetical protein
MVKSSCARQVSADPGLAQVAGRRLNLERRPKTLFCGRILNFAGARSD